MLPIDSMSTLNESLSNNPWWKSMHDRYIRGEPSNQHYGLYPLNQTVFRPLTIDSNVHYTVDLERSCGGPCAYNIGGVSPLMRRTQTLRGVNQCSDATGAPHLCAEKYMGRSSIFGTGKYDRLGH